jgi:hypothetical protein
MLLTIVFLTITPFLLLITMTHQHSLLVLIIDLILLSYNLFVLIFKKELYALISLPFVAGFSFLALVFYQLYQCKTMIC